MNKKNLSVNDLKKVRKNYTLRIDTIEGLLRLKNFYGLSDESGTVEFLVSKEIKQLNKKKGKKSMNRVFLSDLRSLIGSPIRIEVIDQAIRNHGLTVSHGYITIDVILIDVLVNAATNVLSYIKVEDQTGTEHLIKRNELNGVFA